MSKYKYQATQEEGGIWQVLPIPPIRPRKMEKILRNKLNWVCRFHDAPAGNLTNINAGFWDGEDFSRDILVHSVLFPDGRIWDSYFRGFRR